MMSKWEEKGITANVFMNFYYSGFFESWMSKLLSEQLSDQLNEVFLHLLCWLVLKLNLKKDKKSIFHVDQFQSWMSKEFLEKVKSQVEQFSEHPGKTASLLVVLHVDVVQPNPRHTIVFHLRHKKLSWTDLADADDDDEAKAKENLIDHIFNLRIGRPILGLHVGIDQKSHLLVKEMMT